MKLGKAGWLATLLGEVVASHSPQGSAAVPGNLAGSRRARARAYLRRSLRESGLLYGTPASESAASGPAGAPGREETLFLAVVRTFARIALDLCWLLGVARPRAEELLVLFAVLPGQLEAAEEIDRRLTRSREEELPRRLWRKVEAALEEHAPALSGDPAYGLLLHNGALYADAQLFGRQALDYFTRGRLSPRTARRRLGLAARQKALVAEVLTALACAERPPGYPARRAILRQVDDLHLPGAIASSLRARVKKSFEASPSLEAVVKGVRSRDARRFVLEQALLAALVDGRRSEHERAFIQKLAAALGIGTPELAQVELAVAEFYAQHRSVVDVFTLSPRAAVLGEELVESIQRTVEKNLQRLMVEVRETGELSVLLAQAARGQRLTEEEKAKVRSQLIDVAKAIPALAIFAAPGGLLLLAALSKVLPFNLWPSAFQEPAEETPPRQPTDRR